MPARNERFDAEPFKPNGSPVPLDQLLSLSAITPQDVEAALDLVDDAYPPRFKELLG
jgi:hypothetical protein